MTLCKFAKDVDVLPLDTRGTRDRGTIGVTSEALINRQDRLMQDRSRRDVPFRSVFSGELSRAASRRCFNTVAVFNLRHKVNEESRMDRRIINERTLDRGLDQLELSVVTVYTQIMELLLPCFHRTLEPLPLDLRIYCWVSKRMRQSCSTTRHIRHIRHINVQNRL